MVVEAGSRCGFTLWSPRVLAAYGGGDGGGKGSCCRLAPWGGMRLENLVVVVMMRVDTFNSCYSESEVAIA